MALVIEEAAVESLPVTVNPAIMSGTPVFKGTRVPIEALLDNLASGVLKSYCPVFQSRLLRRWDGELLRMERYSI